MSSLTTQNVKTALIDILNNNAEYPADNPRKAKDRLDQFIEGKFIDGPGPTHMFSNPEESKALIARVRNNFGPINNAFDAYVAAQGIPKTDIPQLWEALDYVLLTYSSTPRGSSASTQSSGGEHFTLGGEVATVLIYAPVRGDIEAGGGISDKHLSFNVTGQLGVRVLPLLGDIEGEGWYYLGGRASLDVIIADSFILGGLIQFIGTETNGYGNSYFGWGLEVGGTDAGKDFLLRGGYLKCMGNEDVCVDLLPIAFAYRRRFY